MKSKNNNIPVPLKLVQEYTKRYPSCWDICDDIHNSNGRDGLPEWNTVCELPISATLSIMDYYHDRGYAVNPNIFPSEMAALYIWRKYKEIYSFDHDLANMLMSQGDDSTEIPIEILLKLPYPCIYIKTSDSSGFFVWIEDDVYTHVLELRFLVYENNKNPVSYILHMKNGWTIQDGITDAIETAKANRNHPEIIENIEKYGIQPNGDIDSAFEYTKNVIFRLLQLVLYVCADNKDSQPNENITRRSDVNLQKNSPKDVFRELQQWDVGYRIGNTIRQYNNTNSSNKTDHKSQSSKRPHSRRGHWHHFWIGKKNEKQTLILKWVSPIFVNGSDDDNITTIHDVK